MSTLRVKRDERIEARISSAQKRVLEQAASLAGVSLTNFVIQAADRVARETLDRNQVIELQEADQQILADLLQNPPKPNKALRDAKRQHSLLFGDE